MMEKITKYKAIDGKEFDSEDTCKDYEDLIERVNEIMSVLSDRPKVSGCDFENGKGFIQHNPSLVKDVRLNLLKEFKRKIKHHWIQQSIDDEKAHPSYIDRLVGDYGISPYNSAWYRIQCIDELGREWGQIYFRNHPNEAKQFQLN